MPKQGVQAPWKVYQNYFSDRAALKWKAVTDDVIHFGKKGSVQPEPVLLQDEEPMVAEAAE